jgi:predicted nuclease of predicted toxin-antitoxin system
MKLLLDQGLARSAVQHLAALGISAEHVGDLGLAAASDEAILDAARQRNAVVVTLDADFHQQLAVTRATDPSVIRIRIERLKAEEVAKIIEQVIAVAGADFAAGAVVSVTKTRIRVRSLPIGRR